MPPPENRPLRLLISRAPQDHELERQLVQHLQVLVHTSSIELWTSDSVRAGENHQHVSDAALERTDVALLLLSADFLASEFLQNVELPKLLQRTQLDGLTVIPVLIRSCLWQVHPWLSTLSPLPTNGEPIASLQGDSRDRVLTEIAAEIALRAGSIPGRIKRDPHLEIGWAMNAHFSAALGEGRNTGIGITRAVELGAESSTAIDVLFEAWSREAAVGCVLEQLRSFGGPFEYGLGDLSPGVGEVSHEVLDFLHLGYVDHSAYIAVAVTRTVPRNDCHASAPSLSFVELVETPKGWIWGAVRPNALHAGAWGDPPSGIRAMKIGHNIFSIVIEGGYAGQGYTMGYVSIHAIVGEKFTEVFTADTFGDDSGTGQPHKDGWRADIKTVQRVRDFYDLAVHRHGLRDGNPLDEKVLYRFDGRAYVPLGSYR